MKKIYEHKNFCRICGGRKLAKILNLGKMSLANSFLDKRNLKEKELEAPLAVYFCRKCGLLQLLDVVDPKVLFKNYHYETSTSPGLVRHFKETAELISKKFISCKNDLFIDIGGNDGVLLSEVKLKTGCHALNVDPAKNITKNLKKTGIKIFSDFFNSVSANKIIKKYGKAKLITANNVFAHTDEIQDFVKGVSLALADGGVFVFEVHWVANLLGLSGKYGGFDQIYHEHLNYYSLSSIIKSKMFENFGLSVFDGELIPVHGQSMRIYVAKNRRPSRRMEKILEKEKKLGIGNIKTFRKFSLQAQIAKKDLNKIISKIKSADKKIIGYGAPGKSTTLLNFCGIGKEHLDYLVDESALKCGKFAPGSRLEIFPVGKMREDAPDYALLFAWNYADAILEKEKKYRDEGLKFIIPLPKPRIL